VDAREQRRDAFQWAIESVVRAVGRIVVCVEAEAEVSTVMIRSLLNVPRARPCPARQHVAGVFFVGDEADPVEDWAAAATIT